MNDCGWETGGRSPSEDVEPTAFEVGWGCQPVSQKHLQIKALEAEVSVKGTRGEALNGCDGSPGPLCPLRVEQEALPIRQALSCSRRVSASGICRAGCHRWGGLPAASSPGPRSTRRMQLSRLRA